MKGTHFYISTSAIFEKLKNEFIYMRVSFLIFAFVTLILSPNIIHAQVDNHQSMKLDTIKETIIYEYDTIFVAPDTIRMVDTIVNYQSVKPVSIKTQTDKALHWSVGTAVLPVFYNFFEDHKTDSFYIKHNVGTGAELILRASAKKYFYMLRLGLIPIHEEMANQNIYLTSVKQNSAYYDSLSVTNNCISNNYYNYLSFAASLGRKWGEGKLYFSFHLSILTDILVKHDAILPVITKERIADTSINKFSWGVAVNPCVGYVLSKRLEIFLSPYYRYSFFQRNKYPNSDLQILSAATGLHFNF